MMEDLDVWMTLAIRTTNAILWSILLARIYRAGLPVMPLVRTLIVSVVFLGMWVLVLGSLTSLGIVESGTARVIYTVFTAYSAIVAAGILASRVTPPHR